jgi:hypothetical protein
MKKLIFPALGLIALLALINACSKQTATINVDLGKEYYPIATGKSITYLVDSTIYDDFTGTITKTKSYIKDVIDTSYLDIQNRVCYFVKRYYKSGTDSNFEFSYLYTVQNIDNRIELVYDNLRYIKLVFPITYLGTWGGNGYINTSSSKEPYAWLGDKPYNYKDVAKPFKNDSLTFANTLTVFQKSELNGDTAAAKTNLFGDYSYGLERYAKDIGLVYKETQFIKKDPAVGGGKLKGFITKINCIAYQ